MATVTSNASCSPSSLSVSKNNKPSGTISWSKPAVPEGATISSCVLTGTPSISNNKVSATVNGTSVHNGTQFSINLGNTNATTSVNVTTNVSGNSSGTVSFSNLVYTVTYTEAPTDILISNVSFNTMSLTVNEGETGTIVATVTPSNATEKMTWSIDSTSIATISVSTDGKTVTVTGVSAGSTSLRAFYNGGGMTARLDVTVVEGSSGGGSGDDEQEPTQHTLTITSNEDWGYVVDNKTQQTYRGKTLSFTADTGQTIPFDLTAYPDEGYYIAEHTDIVLGDMQTGNFDKADIGLTVPVGTQAYNIDCQIVYAPLAKTYTITFKDWNGTVLDTQTVSEGDSATAPTAPVRDGYAFIGWDQSFTNVTSDLVVTAQYTNGSTIGSSGVVTHVVIKGDCGYVRFTNNATGDVYTITRTIDVYLPSGTSYSVNAKSYDGYKIQKFTKNGVDMGAYGQTSYGLSEISSTSYTYEITFPSSITYTVTFKDWDGTVLKTETVEEGNNATAPSNPTRDGYTFTGWSGSYTNVTSDVTITAQYTQDSSGGEEPEIPEGELVTKTEALRPNSVTQDSGYNNTWTDVANTYDTDTSTSGTIEVTGSSQSGFKRKYVDTVFNFDTSHIPADATINNATLTIRAKQSATTNLNITASINGTDVIASTLLSSSTANYTADVKDYVKGLDQLNVNLTSAATSNRTFTLYDVRIDVDYSYYEIVDPDPTPDPGPGGGETTYLSKLHLGNVIVDKLYLGSGQVKKIYIGGTLIYEYIEGGKAGSVTYIASEEKLSVIDVTESYDDSAEEWTVSNITSSYDAATENLNLGDDI